MHSDKLPRVSLEQLLPPIPRGKIKDFRQFLNRQNAEQAARQRQKAVTDPGRIETRHRNGRFHQRTRGYGDYLYAQDRDKFMVDLREWLAKPPSPSS